MSRGLPEAPRWAWALIILGVAAMVVMLPIALNRGAVDDSSRTQAAGTAPSSTATSTSIPTTNPPPQPMKVLVIGNGAEQVRAPGYDRSVLAPDVVAFDPT